VYPCNNGEAVQLEGGSLWSTFSVEGLPEPVARAVQAMVQALREQLAKDQKKEPGELPVWHGTVIGSLNPRRNYDDIA
jgi:hypothetical protein